MIVLAFFLLTKPQLRHQPPPKNFRSEVIEMLRLNNQQASHFNELADEHKQKMEEINKRQARLLFPYFESLTNSVDSIGKDSILNKYQQLEMEKIEMTYQHFQDIEKSLNKEQLSDFKYFIKKATNKLLLSKKKHSPPPKDFD
ncbi:hypothetical protein [Aquimarina sp. MMG016]|uniref:hypothetical protein n=1 Tax=Aquimarina sp. MMG016 TaxID=2822690 RepID=UPI001B3A3B87|nr:hypothetical protein [Aquimarina sp. MMG016]MBQ4821887.1 hypothetical protein [Aquimarina sp. MMG016]